MKLIVMGQQAFGKDCLAKILEAGVDEVVAVYCEPDREGKPVDPIKEFALEQGLPMDDPEAREAVYGMPYGEWKAQHQAPATDEQKAALKSEWEMLLQRIRETMP